MQWFTHLLGKQKVAGLVPVGDKNTTLRVVSLCSVSNLPGRNCLTPCMFTLVNTSREVECVWKSQGFGLKPQEI